MSGRMFTWITALLCLAAFPFCCYGETEKYGPGVTDTEIKIGQTMPYSGPASAYATCGITHQRFFKSINENGGINGRKIKLISLDDSMMPAKTVEHVRRLVEHDQVLLLFSILGPGGLSILDYVDRKKVPFLFPAGAALKFHMPDKHPWTMGWVPTFEFEGRVYAKYILQNRPDAKIGILWEDDDMGREQVQGVKLELGAKAASMIVSVQSYMLTDPTISSQVIALKAAGADTIINLSTPKFAALSIRKVYDMGWHPLHVLTYTASSVSATLKPAGLEKSAGLISAYFGKSPSNPAVQDDVDVKEYLAWKAKYYSDGDVNDICLDYSYMQAHLLVRVLEQCGDDLTRKNVMRQARNLKNVRIPLLAPGITIDTSPTDYRPIQSMRFMRFDGKQWNYFGELMIEK
jgi:ABC-type branched-subunit amino acid transport system substrate-binding protein